MSNNEKAIQKSLELLRAIISPSDDDQLQLFDSNLISYDFETQRSVNDLLAAISNRDITVREFQDGLTVILNRRLSEEDLLMESK